MRTYICTLNIILLVILFLNPNNCLSENLSVWKGESVELMCPIPPQKGSGNTVYSQFYEWQKCPDGIDLIQVGGTRHVKITINKFFTDTRTVVCKVKWYESNSIHQQFGPYVATYRWNISYYKVKAIPNQSTYTLNVGQKQQIGFELTPRPSYPDAFVSFTSTDPNIATVDNAGNILGIKSGICEIVLKTNYDVEYSCKIIVRPIEAQAITLNKNNIELKPNEQFSLMATFQPSNCTNKSLSFTSSDNNVVDISEQGVITAKSVGNATIIVSTTNGITNYCNVKVNPISVSQIKLESSNINLFVGDTIRIKATIIPNNSTNKNILYQMSNPDIATIEDNGIIKANKSGTSFINLFIDNIENRAILTVRENIEDKYKINFSDYSVVKINDNYQTFFNQNYTVLVAAHSDYHLTTEDMSESWSTSFSNNISELNANPISSELHINNILQDNNIYILHTYLHNIIEYDILAGLDQIIDENFNYISDKNVLEFKNLPNNNIISLFDLTGKLIYQNSLNATYKSFAIPCNGVFIVEIKTAYGIKSYKLKL